MGLPRALTDSPSQPSAAVPAAAGPAPASCYSGLATRFSTRHLVNAVAGAGAGAIAAAIVCPLDVVKTRIQCEQLGVGGRSTLLSSGIMGALRTVVREEGVRGMYKGLTPTMLALLPNWAVYFSVYEGLKRFLAPEPSDGSDPAKRSSAVHMTAAVGAGASTVVTTNPLWVVKTRLQVDGANCGTALGVQRVPYKGTVDGLRRIVAEEGAKGLYSGLGPALVGVSHVAIQFPVYERMKSWLAERSEKRISELSISEMLAASVVSKIAASTATYPHEVVRARMQLAGLGPFKGSIATIKQLYAEGRVRAFYRGCGTNLIRTTPAAAITLLSFELINRSIDNYLLEGGEQR